VIGARAWDDPELFHAGKLSQAARARALRKSP
jgi:hypothetical protein